MGFHTSIYVVYPFRAPRVTSDTILQLRDELLADGSVAEQANHSMSIKYGKAVDKDRRPGTWLLPTSVRGIFVHDSDYDAHYGLTPEKYTDFLGTDRHQPIYRLLGELGHVLDSDYQFLKREPGPENKEGLYPYDVGILLDRIEVEGDGDSDKLIQVGWIALTIGGSGYCFPWSYQELIDRALETRAVPAAMAAMDKILGGGSEDWRGHRSLNQCAQRARQLDNKYIIAVRGI